MITENNIMFEEFKCTRCGECCKMSPKLDKKDIRRIKKHRYKPKDFVEMINGTAYMKMAGDRCIFLGGYADGSYFCKIHEFKPNICNIYPGKFVYDCKPEKFAFDAYLEKKRFNEQNN